MQPASSHAFKMSDGAVTERSRAVTFLERPPESSIRPRRALVAESTAMSSVVASLSRLAAKDVTLTLVGETGTGKDVLAHYIHHWSPRALSPFVIFDCAAVAKNLAESELLGHERGAFTGAHAAHLGAFERAHGGTVFLDEIGELPLDLQPRLLRVLENRVVRRVGGSQERHVDVRVIAATNRSLEHEVAAGRFRQDLFYRLAGAVVPIPALRQRRADLAPLAAAVLTDLGQPGITLTRDALEVLENHTWPGNVRELKNVLGCAVAFLDGRTLAARHLQLAQPAASGDGCQGLHLAGFHLLDIEREAIRQTLEQVHGNKAAAARCLGIAVSTLYEKLKRHVL
jgi:DNA-binding NtrC family response regulator